MHTPTDTAVTDHAASDASILGCPYISPSTQSVPEEAPSSPSSLAAPGFFARDTGITSSSSTTATATPPPSPSSTRRPSLAMDFDTRPRKQTRTWTPPSTPTRRRSHSKSSSVSSTSIREELDKLRRGMSPFGHCFEEDAEQPGSTSPREFPVWLSDYELETDDLGAQKVLGCGAWSTVYLARPRLPRTSNMTYSPSAVHDSMTPPLSPVRSRGSSTSSTSSSSSSPAYYAIKLPAERTAVAVLTHEARILSYLTRLPSAARYLVPFYGQDPRSHALVLAHMPSSLDTLLTADLNTRSESDRGAFLADLFPPIASNLLDGLAWLHAHAVVHGDVKPANVLLDVSRCTRVPHAVYADFSASTLTSCSSSSLSKEKLPTAGATWDYMSPAALLPSSAHLPPTPAADVWALAMTLLVLVTGQSPYERVAPNAVLKRELLKQGTPLGYVGAGEHGVRSVVRMGGLSRALGFNVKRWLAGVLGRKEGERMGVGEWREELGDALA